MSQVGVLQVIEISKIRHPLNQLRQALDHLDDLADSIRQHGLLQPIVVRPAKEGYEVVAGNRRLESFRLLKLRKIGCHVIELSDKEAYEVALVENVQRKTMTPMEEAIAFNKYVEAKGWGGVSELAKCIGRSQEFVTKRIQLLRLPEKIQEEIIRQRITPSVALEMLPIDKQSIESFNDFVITNNLTKYETRRIVKMRSKHYNKRDPAKNIMTYEKEMYLLDRTLKRTIATLKLSLVNFDDIIDDTTDKWILKEILMQYRQIVHGDIDTFLKFRKKIALKIPREYLELSKSKFDDKADDLKGNSPIHVWIPKGLWQ
ncbi:MAG: ParB/RepB/Spo0J family partition protein [Nitrosotalea sp.]